MVVAGCVSEPPSESPRAAEQSGAEARKVVARVNGEPIYEDLLQPAVQRSLAQYARRGAQTDNTELVKRLQTAKLNELIGNLLIRQESEKQTVENMDEKVAQRVKDLEEKYGAGQRMAKYLKMRRLTMDGLKESLEVSGRCMMRIRKVFPRPRPSGPAIS
jgi:hypothetical protein